MSEKALTYFPPGTAVITDKRTLDRADMFEELVERLTKAAAYVDMNSEPWYKTGQALLADLYATIDKAEKLK